MKPIARKGDLHRCPVPGHGVTEIVSDSPSRVEGRPVARVGGKTGCGATIIEGSGSATTDGRVASRVEYGLFMIIPNTNDMMGDIGPDHGEPAA